MRGFGIDAARFVPPALDHAVERGSLIAAIDSVPAPARWLCAPSGAGKSTLVADVARHHAGNVIWYRLDERDDDPAFFFGEWLRHVRLRSARPEDAPLIDPNYWSDPHDRTMSLEGLKIAREIFQQAALKPYNTQLFRGMLGELQNLVLQAEQQAQPWLGGSRFGALDAYSLTLTRWGTIAGVGPQEHPALWRFVEKVAAEPAVARVMARERLQLNMSAPA